MTSLVKTNTKPDPKKDEDEFIKRYDVNDDGYVNVFDIVDLAKAIVGQYEKEGFDKDLSQYKNRKLEEKDLNIIKDAFQPFSNNRYKWNGSIVLKHWTLKSGLIRIIGKTSKNGITGRIGWERLWKLGLLEGMDWEIHERME